MVVGNGWFARLSCEADGDMILGWEQSDGIDPKADDTEQAAYVTSSVDGTIRTCDRSKRECQDVRLGDSAGRWLR
ncbi:MAG: hypothetical protein C4321_03125 [Chloroflexota bacterium]